MDLCARGQQSASQKTVLRNPQGGSTDRVLLMEQTPDKSTPLIGGLTISVPVAEASFS
jgi:hypothetical protein